MFLLLTNLVTRLRCSRGTTTPEYAILTFVIIIVAIAAIGALGRSTTSAVQNVGVALDDSGATDEHLAQRTAGASDFARRAEAVLSWPHWSSALNLLMVGLAAGWLILRRKPAKVAITPAPQADELPEVVRDADVEKRQQISQRLYNDTDTLLRGDVEIRHVMTKSPCTVGPRETLARACQIMQQRRVEYLLVCDAQGGLLGLLSHHYLVRSQAKRVVDAMLPEPLCVAPDDRLSPTVTRMIDKGVSCVPVVDQGRIVGVVTTRDLQLALQAALHVLAKATSERRFAEPEPIC